MTKISNRTFTLQVKGDFAQCIVTLQHQTQLWVRGVYVNSSITEEGPTSRNKSPTMASSNSFQLVST